MTYDRIDQLKAFHDRMHLGYPLLHDADARHVNALGIRNRAYEKGHSAYGIPHPGILLLSPEGKVLARFAVPGYRQRPPLDEVLAVVRERVGGGVPSGSLRGAGSMSDRRVVAQCATPENGLTEPRRC